MRLKFTGEMHGGNMGGIAQKHTWEKKRKGKGEEKRGRHG